ncbi:succinyl-diaminopimelate desuccinylase [Sanguibacter antarcticus]|uniref:succinyl-diaminopimelate desuccinylase n=1 Tax=Sanguibacter antarcticus TaxID=372484 RepID=UPI001B80989E|nr:succinyl-diaminopimelate desuccinylase [Sanguibacter antarcticus]
MPEEIDVVALTQALVRCRSVTPADDGALDVVQAVCEGLGFTVTRLEFDGTPNLFARRGSGSPHVCFAGHTDVVPAGASTWTSDPFAADVRDGVIVGRGTSDMKGAVAAFLAAVGARDASTDADASISLLITGDEEGPATGGTVRVLEWMAANGHVPDFCIVGEATNPTRMGETIKIGRRGSIGAHIVVEGTQGHVAYPHRVDNPVHSLVGALHELSTTTLDEGTDWFEPSSLQVTSVDVGNPTTNLVPAVATARLNIRFNDLHTGRSLERLLHDVLSRHCTRFTLDATIGGEAFLTVPDAATFALAAAVEQVTGTVPTFNTTGGTSDARFVSGYCRVAELGLVGATIHQVDESTTVDDLHQLTAVYAAALDGLLRADGPLTDLPGTQAG